MTTAAETAAFQHWRGGSRWHHRQRGYAGHIVQVVDDFGSLVAVRGRLRSRPWRSEVTGSVFYVVEGALEFQLNALAAALRAL